MKLWIILALIGGVWAAHADRNMPVTALCSAITPDKFNAKRRKHR